MIQSNDIFANVQLDQKFRMNDELQWHLAGGRKDTGDVEWHRIAWHDTQPSFSLLVTNRPTLTNILGLGCLLVVIYYISPAKMFKTESYTIKQMEKFQDWYLYRYKILWSQFSTRLFRDNFFVDHSKIFFLETETESDTITKNGKPKLRSFKTEMSHSELNHFKLNLPFLEVLGGTPIPDDRPAKGNEK